jgi:polyribonucleotide nucleotidyltransferase
VFNIIEKDIIWGGRKLSLQTGKIARQADGAVIAKYGDTAVLATVVFEKKPKAGLDFFPLTVNYQDKYYAVGKIPGGFFKREGKPTEREILISRLIDRPIRPLFDERFRNEVQVVVSTLSYDGENSADVLSVIAASAALAISGVPFLDVVSAAKVGYVNGEFVLNPLVTENKSTLDLVVAGTKEGVLMVESEAKELTEEQLLSAVKFAHKSFEPVINLIKDMQSATNKPKYVIEGLDTPEIKDLEAKIIEIASNDLKAAFALTDKISRGQKVVETENNTLEKLKELGVSEDVITNHFSYYFKKLEKDIVRGNILNSAKRIDGRKLDQVRPIVTEVDVFNRVHGSALFTRGETQALVVTTLGTEADEQILDDLENSTRERFMLHYNFPAFSVGEVGRMSGPGRREIGHGKLAWRAINPMLPGKDEFPYTIRVVSEITESNGSSSMATVCGASLSLMAAGVPIKKPIAGIAMGLIKEDSSFAVLTDILGDEDHLGDMDFKVAGTKDGITSLQMDIKITSVTYEIMEKALSQAKQGRLHIIGEMSKSITEAKKDLSEFAPKIVTLQINKDKIREVIGSGGKVIKEICELNSVKVDISEEGLVKIAGVDPVGIQKAYDTIYGITAEAEVGKIYEGKVVKVLEFGAFVNFMGNKDGLVHVSEFVKSREDNINDFVKEGDILSVKVMAIDDKGKIKLSIKNI